MPFTQPFVIETAALNGPALRFASFWNCDLADAQVLLCRSLVLYVVLAVRGCSERN